MLFSMQAKTHNLAEFQKAAQDFILGLTPLPDHATVVGLFGDLGAGKTTFVQAAAKALGVVETLNSPTFLILKSYKLKASSYKLLHHIDAYRLKSFDELARLRFDELLADPKNLILIEWADKVTDLLPKEHLKLHLEFINDNTRAITLG
ncbi:MAG: tRNA (adenosine(37)-N6)-threonylcarbamoyltransferase complex ATPase subunit type 1 TsaE [bacterium]|nr:tRNA (adenosine(37)-N6)-threonylcarbamoyltransferase complex ATPase subunit type 1 TsaE [bacterium]